MFSHEDKAARAGLPHADQDVVLAQEVDELLADLEDRKAPSPGLAFLSPSEQEEP